MSENSAVEIEATYGEPRYEVVAERYHPTGHDVVRVYETKDFGTDKDDEPVRQRRQIICLQAEDAVNFTYALVQAGYGPPAQPELKEIDLGGQLGKVPFDVAENAGML